MFDASDRGWQGVQWKFAANTFSPSEPIEDYRDGFHTPGLAALVLAGNPPKPPTLRAKGDRTPTIQVKTGHPSASGKILAERVPISAPAESRSKMCIFPETASCLRSGAVGRSAGAHLSLSADLVAGENSFTAYAFNQDNVKSTDGSWP